MPIIVTGALSALTLAILWLGTRVTELGERVSRMEGQVTILVHQNLHSGD